MLRGLDVLLSLVGILILWPLIILIFLINWLYIGSPLLWQVRVGQFGKPFVLVKFRTMKQSTHHVASHLVSSDAITPLGRFLRKFKLDELPQLWNVLKGEMSLVGPRPCLFNQRELIHFRQMHGVYQARPGITGLGQIRKVDMSTPELLAVLDAEMLKTLTVSTYFSYIFKTLSGAGSGDAARY
jgi:lipopolysaccharide/colanic/teichoic acid biosynthesis glycosyltransferase